MELESKCLLLLSSVLDPDTVKSKTQKTQLEIGSFFPTSLPSNQSTVILLASIILWFRKFRTGSKLGHAFVSEL